MEPEKSPAEPVDPNQHTIERLSLGETDALDDLMDQFQKELIELAVYLTRDFGLAEQIVQETFMAVVRAACDFQGRSKVRTWLQSIVRNKCHDETRRRGQSQTPINRSELSLHDQLQWDTQHSQSPEAIALANVSYQELLAVVKKTLPPRHEKVFLLWAQGYPYAEIAQACDIPIGTVKSRLSYSKGVLAQTVSAMRGNSDTTRGL